MVHPVPGSSVPHNDRPVTPEASAEPNRWARSRCLLNLFAVFDARSRHGSDASCDLLQTASPLAENDSAIFWCLTHICDIQQKSTWREEADWYLQWRSSRWWSKKKTVIFEKTRKCVFYINLPLKPKIWWWILFFMYDILLWLQITVFYFVVFINLRKSPSVSIFALPVPCLKV